jgi:hypothetical protein
MITLKTLKHNNYQVWINFSVKPIDLYAFLAALAFQPHLMLKTD